MGPADTLDAPHPVDVHVGLRVRTRRKLQGLSQSALAEGLGLTFQQVQKYERGGNRISASKLYEMAGVLHVPISYFFEGLDAPDAKSESHNDPLIAEFLETPEGVELARRFTRLPVRGVRRSLLALVRAMVEEQADA